jgi:hypothetical protein
VAAASIPIVGVPVDGGAPLLELPVLPPLLAPVPLDDGGEVLAPELPEDWPEEAAPLATGPPWLVVPGRDCVLLPHAAHASTAESIAR